MNIRKSALLGLLFSFFACVPTASNINFRLIEKLAPAFDDIKIIPPNQDVHPALKAFSGWWVGEWDGILPSQLIVEKIERNSATVVYTWGDHPSGSFEKGRLRNNAKILANGKFEFGTTAHFTFEIDMEKDLVYGVRKKGQNVSKIAMKRKPFENIQKIAPVNKMSLNKGDSGNLGKPEKRLVLLIGNADYDHGGSLTNPVNDVKAMSSTLEDLHFTVTKYENCTQKIMKKAMDEFGRKLGNYDTGLFFYAGHGVQVRGNNYLIPVDAKLKHENDAEYDCVRADRILAKMESAGSKANIVILDACRDNPFERSWRRGAKGRGLAFMNAPSGSIIAYATSPGQTASDGVSGENGLYTSALLKHIGTPNITIEDVFKRVRSTVIQQSEKEQVPWESTSLTGYFYFKNE